MNYKTILSLAFFVAILGAFVIVSKNPMQIGASVRVGDQYQSTTTPQLADRANICPAVYRVGMASSTTGVLGSVNILNANTSPFTIYDATTTDTTLRGNTSTSSLILAEFPASPTEGSYHFDIEFKRGLLVDYDATATVSTSTISYRCEG